MSRPERRRVPKVWAATAIIVVAALAVGAAVKLWPEGTPPRRILPGTKQFETLPPGSTLPSGAECAERIRPAPEVVPDNATANATTWHVAWTDGKYPSRADGDFTGTTDEIIQWAACKWGMDEDILRAQAYQESHWRMDAYGDANEVGVGEDGETICAPGPGGTVRDDGTCAESIGIMQVRTQYYRPAAEGAVASTAYNLDVSLSMWRECFEGDMQYLQNIAPDEYRAGDVWGCVGRWFAGNWYSEAANGYIDRVRHHLDHRVWEYATFRKP